MKYLLTAFVFTFLYSSSISQPLTKAEFESSILSEFKSDLNITSLSNGFKNCAYDSYLKKSNAIENDFELGRQIGLQSSPLFNSHSSLPLRGLAQQNCIRNAS